MNDHNTPEDEAARERRQAAAARALSDAHASVRAVSMLLEDPAHITEAPIFVGASTTERRARPLTRLQAAVWLRGTAGNLVRSGVSDARGAGASWAEIAKVLDLPAGDDPAAAAYESAVGDGWDARFSFTCGTCGAWITDHGPYDHHPDDRESGHTDRCERQRAARAEWKAENDDE